MQKKVSYLGSLGIHTLIFLGKELIEDGSTAVCVLLRGSDLYVAHAGMKLIC